MQHTCYHIISDHKNEYLSKLKDVKSTLIKWQNNGESHINVYKIVTEDLDSDEIMVNEESIRFDDININ